MFLAYQHAMKRKEIIPYYTASNKLLTAQIEEESIVNTLIGASEIKGPHDLAAFYFLREVTPEKQLIIDSLLKCGIPVAIFSPKATTSPAQTNNHLLQTIKIPEEMFAQFQEGPVALYSINDNIKLIYPEDSPLFQLDANNRNHMMIQLIEPLCHIHGIDFPLDDPLFRMLRHSEYFESTKQWEKIIRLGTQAVHRKDTINPQIYLSMCEAAIQLSNYQEAIWHSVDAYNLSNEHSLKDIACQAEYFRTFITWTTSKLNVFESAAYVYHLYVRNQLDNKLLQARIDALLLMIQLEYPTTTPPISQDRLSRDAAVALECLKAYDKMTEFDHFSIALAAYYLKTDQSNEKCVRAEYYLAKVSDKTKQGNTPDSAQYALQDGIVKGLNGDLKEAAESLNNAKELARKHNLISVLSSIDLALHEYMPQKTQSKKATVKQ